MPCPKCAGLVIHEHDEWRCVQCGLRPFERILRVKCASVECRQMPTINGFCQPCYVRYQRSNLTDAMRSAAYREKNRLKQQRRRQQLRERQYEQSDAAQ